jgi:hypothetical protein
LASNNPLTIIIDQYASPSIGLRNVDNETQLHQSDSGGSSQTNRDTSILIEKTKRVSPQTALTCMISTILLRHRRFYNIIFILIIQTIRV